MARRRAAPRPDNVTNTARIWLDGWVTGLLAGQNLFGVMHGRDEFKREGRKALAELLAILDAGSLPTEILERIEARARRQREP